MTTSSHSRRHPDQRLKTIAQSYNKTTSPQSLESDFMNISPTMKTYHLPDSGGSYISRYRSISSDIKLTIFLDESIEYHSIYFTTILLDFMAFASHIISKTYGIIFYTFF